MGGGRSGRSTEGERRQGSVAASGRSRVAGARGRARRDLHRDSVGQVARVPAAGAFGSGRGRAGFGALPFPDQGARRRPAAVRVLFGHQESAAGVVRRRHPAGGAGLGPRTRELGVHEPGHAASRDPLVALALVPVLPAALVRRGRRMPQLPRRLRLPRRAAVAQAAEGRGVLRRFAGLRSRVGDDRGPGGVRVEAHRAGMCPGHRGRFAARLPHGRVVGAPAAVGDFGRERGAGAAIGGRRGFPDPRRTGHRGRALAGVRPVPARRGADGARRAADSVRSGRFAGGIGRRVPLRVSAGGASCPRSGVAVRAAARCGDDERTRTRRRHRRAGRGGAGRLSGNARVVLAAGGPGRARGRRGAGRLRGPRRSAGHLSRAPSGRDPGQAGGSRRPRSVEPVCAGSAAGLRHRRTPADRTGGRGLRRRRGACGARGSGQGEDHPSPHERLVLDFARPAALRGRHPRFRRRADRRGGGRFRADARHGRPGFRLLRGASRCGVPAPGFVLCGRRTRSGDGARPGARGGSGLEHVTARDRRHQCAAHRRDQGARRDHGEPRRGFGEFASRRLLAETAVG
ncbi:hypothetical protein C791_4678 [Amycolatopsis azurea DSM 43854]|uniref:Uncharacterized protein n=1 Tax=Amycolatopsis azurea DSM 43854 TaxID=1238180 RepID=M2PM41_9PSEU|nr:hypothetical protein C791_4678 [Amycolatopsis azurea DSM 43854]